MLVSSWQEQVHRFAQDTQPKTCGHAAAKTDLHRVSQQRGQNQPNCFKPRLHRRQNSGREPGRASAGSRCPNQGMGRSPWAGKSDSPYVQVLLACQADLKQIPPLDKKYEPCLKLNHPSKQMRRLTEVPKCSEKQSPTLIYTGPRQLLQSPVRGASQSPQHPVTRSQ